ncbi:Hypothetical predicted protein [Paramuricea clavata]|uniref:Uncharacterized protein n=1 Tax=Paramuricea clavata TaxID=317549 RepID=A0A7D9HQV0_PARCT|nr:Hypothetical predicted protein [Paramuricea clavata]
MRTIDGIGSMFQPLENAISAKLIPALTGRGPCSSVERTILSLPMRHGGLNLVNPVEVANSHYNASLKITEPLKKMIISQTTTYKKIYLHNIKADLRRQKNQYHQQLATEAKQNYFPALLNGCDDTTSWFKHKGNKSFSETWKRLPSLTAVFEQVATSEGNICESDFLEQFVAALYCSTFDGDNVNNARRYLFTSKGKTIDNIPPTAASLNEHVKRSEL